MKTKIEQSELTPYAKALYADRVAAQEAEEIKAGGILSNLMMMMPYNQRMTLTLAAEEVHRLKDDVALLFREHAALVAVAQAANNQMLSMKGVSKELAAALAVLAAVRRAEVAK